MTKIWERIYLGSLKDAEQLARSNPQRITTVVSLCREQSVHRAPKITYIHIPIPDSRPISAQKFEDIMFAMAIGVRRGNLLVHCLAGMSRSPILIAAGSIVVAMRESTKHYPRSRNSGISLPLAHCCKA